MGAQHRIGAAFAVAVAAAALALAACGDSDERSAGDTSAAGGSAERPRFSHPRRIDNRYLPITVHRRCEQRGVEQDGTRTRSVRTVLERSKRFELSGQRVDAIVVRDAAYEDGELVENTFDYFAQADDGTVYYLGEDVDNIERGKVRDHDGSWLLGKHTDVPGVAMPADPKLGAQWRFEDVPGVTTESDRVEEVGLRAQAGGRLYRDVIRVSEFVQPEGEVEQKLYAPGVGQVTEYPPGGRAELVACR